MNQREIKSNIFNMFDKFKQNSGNVTTLEKKLMILYLIQEKVL